MDGAMIFSVKQNSETASYGSLDMTITLPYDATMGAVLEAFERMALALTFSQYSLREAYETRLSELRSYDEHLKRAVREDILNDLYKETEDA